jgi:acyl-CoA synthetase (NDP forming)
MAEITASHVSGAREAVQQVLARAKAEKRTSLTAPEGKLVCGAYGIAVPEEGVAASAQEAVSLASGMGFPVVLKIVSPDTRRRAALTGTTSQRRGLTPRS